MLKKSILLLVLAAMIFTAGCRASVGDTPQVSTTPTTATTPETTVPAESEAAATTAPATESTAQTTQATEQTNPPSDEVADSYLASLKAQADTLEASLEQDTLTQSDMNRISYELYTLWDDALNDLWGKLQDTLPEDEFDRLLDEQLVWIEEKESAAAEAGQAAQGGSLAQLLVNMKAAEMTEVRVYELYEILTSGRS